MSRTELAEFSGHTFAASATNRRLRSRPTLHATNRRPGSIRRRSLSTGRRSSPRTETQSTRVYIIRVPRTLNRMRYGTEFPRRDRIFFFPRAFLASARMRHVISTRPIFEIVFGLSADRSNIGPTGRSNVSTTLGRCRAAGKTVRQPSLGTRFPPT